MNFKNVVWFIKAMLLLLLKMKQQQRVAIKCKENSEKKNANPRWDLNPWLSEF